eukprot:CAMPEP_0182419458 /NCGR_PEP_ID=MMETSP1167-20130531/3919_1 /TAXON_ID=2988 /ORGANISM="Mallomonas Sp, Strain CCMP3275" /LENGTH=473 /DNA_ID=CAMNT_0024594403 /DNA_START=326 /DNA_END=1744 /DNA_ORIENTATION=+
MPGFYDYGPLGVELKQNIKNIWWKEMVQRREDVVGLDASIIASPSIYEASGHVSGFSDPMVDCKQSKMRFRADQVFWGRLETEEGEEACYVSILESDTMLEDAMKAAKKKAKKLGVKGPYKPLELCDLTQAAEEVYQKIPSPSTGEEGQLTLPRDFNLMFKTSVGAMSDATSLAYLRPETAQGIFCNYMSIQRTARMKIPFGIAQIGKAFRNEITPRNYIFRSREFEQMEIEYFIPPEDDAWRKFHATWVHDSWRFLRGIGLREDLMSFQVHTKNKLAHYAKACTDVVFKFPFGTQELMGVAARGCYDLGKHAEASGKSQEYFDEENKRKYIPHVIEPSYGVDRLFLAAVVSAYREEQLEGEKRTVLGFHPSIAPVKVSILPLVKNKPEIVALAKEIFSKLQRRYNCEYDVSGAIGRRYRRADEIGTPFCVTVDFDSLEDRTVTLRLRDSMKQERIKIEDLYPLIAKEIEGEW